MVEESEEFASAVQSLLHRNAPNRFDVARAHGGQETLELLATKRDFDLILIDHFLTGQSGVDLTMMLKEQDIQIPVVFLTANKDFDLALEVMHLGVEDYIMKEDARSNEFPGILEQILERSWAVIRVNEEAIAYERLQAIQKWVGGFRESVESPIAAMKPAVRGLAESHGEDNLKMYVSIIRDNHLRIETKLARLQQLDTDKTVPYIKDIRMFDLS